MNVVDSSGWLEYFTEGENARFFSGAIEKTELLVVPTLSILEVFKKVLREKGESEALEAAALMQQGEVVELSLSIAIHAAKLGQELKLPLADSVIYATARAYKAILWTQDSDFKDLSGVKFIEKKK